jgi:hydrogenase nickel incorporation protein HypA/HybF
VKCPLSDKGRNPGFLDVSGGVSDVATVPARFIGYLRDDPRGGRCGTVHELSICSSIADIARRRADGRTITVINVRVGQLRQIVPDTLVYCWSLVSEETALAGSRIVVESVPARIRCRSCQHTADVGDLPSFACAACGGIDVEIVAGEEFLITSLELAEEGADG